MKRSLHLPWASCGAFTLLLAWTTLPAAQTAPQFTGYQRLTNQEMQLRLSGPNGLSYRIDASTNLPQWFALAAATSTGVVEHADSAAPFNSRRFYRASQLTNATIVTGDYVVTTNGEVIIHPVSHASLALSWSNVMIYVDPANVSFSGLPKADLILYTHDHGDHYVASAIPNLKGPTAVIVAPQYVYDQSSFGSYRGITTVLANGGSTTKLGILIEAVAAYNTNTTGTVYHPKGRGNGYVLTIGGKRIYLSGDTHNTPEMAALRNIDIAFLAMNQPYTMTVPQAVDGVRSFNPKVVYPYHHNGNPATDLNSFKQQITANPGAEVRLRKWY